MWQAVRENPRAVAYAVLMHLMLLALLVFSLDWTPKISRPPGVKVPIEAELVDSQTLQAIEDRKLEEQRRLEAAEQKRKAEAEAKAKAEAEQKRKAEAEAKAKAEAERKRKAEAEAKAKAEAEMRRQIAAEQEEARARSALSEYIPYIQDKVTRNWLRPPGSAAGLSCLIRVRLIPGGDVVSATVIRSSGDPMFDRSVETAVLKASPLPLPTDASLFKHFREINFNFDPGR
jgi:colicin import membrane protein